MHRPTHAGLAMYRELSTPVIRSRVSACAAPDPQVLVSRNILLKQQSSKAIVWLTLSLMCQKHSMKSRPWVSPYMYGESIHPSALCCFAFRADTLAAI